MNHLRELIEAIEQKTLVLMVENEKDEEYEAADARHATKQVMAIKWTWVQPCIVGNKSAGIVHKDYRLTGLPHNDQGKPRAEAGEARCSESA